jgi:selenide,water dikinase
VLRSLQGTFNPADYPDLIVGLDDPDDAAIWRLDERRALVVTTDFFTPVVDDAYDYGAIAAANALSDVYAMGGRPFLALNIAALPPDLPAELVGEILLGGAETAREAGVVIAGGHTVTDKEPKYGLVVIGFVDPRRILTKGGAHPGDKLVLSKPLGFGTTTTALKRQQARAEDVREVTRWMKRLNRVASSLAVEFDLRSGTDVTGFSLLGHAWEIAQASGVRLRFSFESLPFVGGAKGYAAEWIFPGGAVDNRSFYSPHVKFSPEIDEASTMLLFDPQTSGGLLLCVPEEKLEAFLARAQEIGHRCGWWAR